jgi:hypothetical protein
MLEKQARRLASRVVHARTTDKDRFEYLLELTWSRPPIPEEMTRQRDWLERADLALREGDLSDEERELDVWTSCARVTLMANEFLYVD